MRQNDTEQPLEAFVDALVDIGGPLTGIVNHMIAHGGSPAADSIPTVLRRLLAEVFQSELEVDPETLQVAARALDAAGEAIEQNIYLVPRDSAGLN
jgi:hypothetical protein